MEPFQRALTECNKEISTSSAAASEHQNHQQHYQHQPQKWWVLYPFMAIFHIQLCFTSSQKTICSTLETDPGRTFWSLGAEWTRLLSESPWTCLGLIWCMWGRKSAVIGDAQGMAMYFNQWHHIVCIIYIYIYYIIVIHIYIYIHSICMYS